MIDELLLLSGNDIPFFQAGLVIHPPTIKEIAYITEQRFWLGCSILTFNKNSLSSQQKKNLSNKTNFDIINIMLKERSLEAKKSRIGVSSILALIFPIYQISFENNCFKMKNHQTGEQGEINNDNFEKFKEILISIFCLVDKENKQYNPSGSLAEKIANKFAQGRQQRAKLAPDSGRVAILSRYVSILAVGQQKDINSLMGYTIYQLMDEFNRFELKLHYDSWERFKIAGATGMEDPEDWLKDIHEDKQKNNR